jgi:hypothetical protein
MEIELNRKMGKLHITPGTNHALASRSRHLQQLAIHQNGKEMETH